jgi:GxxExxY protein
MRKPRSHGSEMTNSLNDITSQIIDAAIKIHRQLGPGLLESVYEIVLTRELERRGLTVIRQHSVSFDFDGMRFDDALKVDLLVVELKSTETVSAVHSKQVLTYLRLMNLQVGLLLNFGSETLRQGIRRISNGYVEFADESS